MIDDESSFSAEEKSEIKRFTYLSQFKNSFILIKIKFQAI